jgi:hypothetical protein
MSIFTSKLYIFKGILHIKPAFLNQKTLGFIVKNTSKSPKKRHKHDITGRFQRFASWTKVRIRTWQKKKRKKSYENHENYM